METLGFFGNSLRRGAIRCVAAGGLAFLASCKPYEGADAIPVIGLDAQGRAAQIKIPRGEYLARFDRVASAYHDSALTALSRTEAANPGWDLRTFTMGVAFSAEVGVGPLRLGAVPRFRLIFTNTSDLLFP